MKRLISSVVLVLCGLAVAQIMPNGKRDSSGIYVPPVREITRPGDYAYLSAKVGLHDGIYRVNQQSGVVQFFDGRSWVTLAGQLDPRTGAEAR